TTPPSGRSTTAPTGTSPCPAASAASSSARRIAGSYRLPITASAGSQRRSARGSQGAQRFQFVQAAGLLAHRGDHVRGQRALLAEQGEQLPGGGAQVGDHGGVTELIVLVLVVGVLLGHAVGEDPSQVVLHRAGCVREEHPRP